MYVCDPISMHDWNVVERSNLNLQSFIGVWEPLRIALQPPVGAEDVLAALLSDRSFNVSGSMLSLLEGTI